MWHSEQVFIKFDDAQQVVASKCANCGKRREEHVKCYLQIINLAI